MQEFIRQQKNLEESSQSNAERDELILEHLPQIKYIAQRISTKLPSHVELNDLVSAGILGLLDAIEKSCVGYDLSASRQVLRDFGNMSSPSVLFALERALSDGAPDEKGDWWLTSFGAGFSAHGCRAGL